MKQIVYISTYGIRFPFSTNILKISHHSYRQLEIFHSDVVISVIKFSREEKQTQNYKQQQSNNDRGKIQDEQGKRKKKLTTPTLTLLGLGSAKKASVTPRIGSFGAGSTLFHQDDMDLAPTPKHLRPLWSKTFLEIAACNAMNINNTLLALSHYSLYKIRRKCERERSGRDFVEARKQSGFGLQAATGEIDMSTSKCSAHRALNIFI